VSLGPAAVVPYVMTEKLTMALTVPSAYVMTTAIPGVYEARVASNAQQTRDLFTALAQLLLLVTGLASCLVLSLNHSFVRWWLGPSYYAGDLVTFSLVIAAIFRQLAALNGTFLLSGMQEKTLTIIQLSDIAITLLASILLCRYLGTTGVALGALVGVASCGFPFSLHALARHLQIPRRHLVAPFIRWAWRFAIVGGACALAGVYGHFEGVPRLIGGALAVTLLYGSLMFALLRKGHLADRIRSQWVRLNQKGPFARPQQW
jgi:O-antigen/teichoic acid export membrane protein